MSKRFLENLVKAGALDQIEPNRNRLMSGLDLIIAHGASLRREQESAQTNLFGGDSGGHGFALELPMVHEMVSREKLDNELDALGLYISAHPLDDFAQQLASFEVISSAEIETEVTRKGNGCRINLAGVVTAKQIRQSKKGNRFAFVQLTDQAGLFEVTVFSETLASSQGLLDADQPLLVRADARIEDGTPRLMAAGFELLEGVASRKSKAVELRLTHRDALKGVAEGLDRDGAGTVRLRIMVPAEDNEVIIDLPGRYRLSSSLRQMLKSIPGVAAMREIG